MSYLSVLKRNAVQRVINKNAGSCYCRRGSSKLFPVSFLKLLDLEQITVGGRGLVRCVPDELNSFSIRGSGLHAGDVQLTISNGDFVSIRPGPDVLHVDYRMHDPVVTIVTISIAGGLHSVHAVQHGFCTAEALEFFSVFQPADMAWINVLQDHCQNRAVVLAASEHYLLRSYRRIESALMSLMDVSMTYHLLDEEVQTASLEVITSVLGLGIRCAGVVSRNAIAAMDAHLSSETVQSIACWTILFIAGESEEHERSLSNGRAFEVCSRAHRLFPRNSRVSKVLMGLQGRILSPSGIS